eukprot:TRINITY_DN5879_c0_g1_i1.p1 TRINITY_DN5879_c0_g1~~TRINITY_DN5879_c0_g1_i1.p1  ORF type:complete len:325 (+),score=103.89 TRINITY_DN5879_c0_g1_i1:106-1080(+)
MPRASKAKQAKAKQANLYAIRDNDPLRPAEADSHDSDRMNAAKLIKHYDFQPGDILDLGNMRYAYAWFVCKDRKTLLRNPDYTAAGYLTVPLEITSLFEDALAAYAKIEWLYIVLGGNDSFIKRKLGGKTMDHLGFTITREYEDMDPKDKDNTVTIHRANEDYQTARTQITVTLAELKMAVINNGPAALKPKKAQPSSAAAQFGSLPAFKAEKAKSGRSKCKQCKSTIPKDTLRIGRVTENPFDEGTLMTNWFLVPCFFEKQMRCRPATVKLESTANLEGFDALDSASQKDIETAIANFNKAYAAKLADKAKSPKKGKKGSKTK